MVQNEHRWFCCVLLLTMTTTFSQTSTLIDAFNKLSWQDNKKLHSEISFSKYSNTLQKYEYSESILNDSSSMHERPLRQAHKQQSTARRSHTQFRVLGFFLSLDIYKQCIAFLDEQHESGAAIDSHQRWRTTTLPVEPIAPGIVQWKGHSDRKQPFLFHETHQENLQAKRFCEASLLGDSGRNGEIPSDHLDPAFHWQVRRFGQLSFDQQARGLGRGTQDQETNH